MSTFNLFLHTFFALAIVLLAIALFSRFMKKGSKIRYKTSKAVSKPFSIEIINRKNITRHSYLLVIQIDGKSFLLSVTQQSVNLISALEGNLEEQTAVSSFNGKELSDLFGSTDTDRTYGSPWKATPRQTPVAWDAFIERLREMTVRH